MLSGCRITFRLFIRRYSCVYRANCLHYSGIPYQEVKKIWI